MAWSIIGRAFCFKSSSVFSLIASYVFRACTLQREAWTSCNKGGPSIANIRSGKSNYSAMDPPKRSASLGDPDLGMHYVLF